MLKQFIFCQFFLIMLCKAVVKPQNCTCVPYYQCAEDENRLLVISDSEQQCEGINVCCITTLQPNIRKLPTTTTKLPITTRSPTTQRIPKTTPLNIFRSPKGCGYTTHNEYPWMGTLYNQRGIGARPNIRCGVSFINEQVAITAAHCFNTDGIWTVKGGDSNTLNSIEKIIIHPKFKRADLHNDIAIIILEEPISDLTNEKLICIPPPHYKSRNTNCMVGSFYDADGASPDEETVVQLINLPLVDRQRCLKALRQTILGDFFQLHHSFVCAGGEMDIDTGKGDGGIPLVCPIVGQRGRYHQIGIVSWGVGNGQHNTPGVYVNVAIYRDWIDEVMADHNFDISGYRY